jgi:hypothetical protein
VVQDLSHVTLAFLRRLQDPDQSQSLLIFTATPGTDSYDKLALLSVLGADSFPIG